MLLQRLDGQPCRRHTVNTHAHTTTHLREKDLEAVSSHVQERLPTPGPPFLSPQCATAQCLSWKTAWLGEMWIGLSEMAWAWAVSRRWLLVGCCLVKKKTGEKKLDQPWLINPISNPGSLHTSHTDREFLPALCCGVLGDMLCGVPEGQI